MAKRVAPGIHLLDLGWFAPFRSNAFLVDDGDLTLIDAGLPLNSPRIRAEIRDAGARVADLDRALITHYDLDHVGGLARLAPAFRGPVYVGRTDLELLRGGHDPPLLHHKGLFHRGLRALHDLPDAMDVRPVDDGDRIGGFRAIHTPGHNPGHVAYLHEGLDAAFLGDLVWSRDGEFTTPIRFDSYDLAEIEASVRDLVDRAFAFEVACVAHGDPITEDGFETLRALSERLERDATA